MALPEWRRDGLNIDPEAPRRADASMEAHLGNWRALDPWLQLAIRSPSESFFYMLGNNPLAALDLDSKELARKAELQSFGRIRFHDLRGVHATALLDAGIPVDSVARRIGDDPAVLLRNYSKRQRTEEAQKKMANVLADFGAGFLGK